MKNKIGIESSCCIPVYRYTLDGIFDKEYHSFSEAARDVNMKTYGPIVRCAGYDDSHHISAGYMWRLYHDDFIPPYTKRAAGKPIYCYDLETRLFIKEYENSVKAGISLTGSRQTHINDVANGKRKSCAGFLWAYDFYERLPEDYYSKMNRKVE